MELRAVHEALRVVPADVPVRLQTDSSYVINVFTQWLPGWIRSGWRTSGKQPVANRRAIELIQGLVQPRDVVWVHVKGHSGHVENELADRLARNAAEAQKSGVRVDSGPQGCLRRALAR